MMKNYPHMDRDRKPEGSPRAGGDLFIVDNSDADWKVLQYLREWAQISTAFDIATGFFEIGSLLALDGEWQKLDKIRILMGAESTKRTRAALLESLKASAARQLDLSIEREKEQNDFLKGVPAIVEALRRGQIECRVYTKEKFHAKAYITHAKLAVVGSAALVGSSNFTLPGLNRNIELNIQIRREVELLQDWFERHWEEAEDATPDILGTIERHTRDYTPFDVYAKSLSELSRVYPILDQYQKDGFHELMKIADDYHGAFLCDGVGLGKTFVGLMVIEYLIEKRRKRVALFVPKASRKPVWERALAQYAPHLRGVYSGLQILNHTDLLRKAGPDSDYPSLIRDVKDRAEIIMVDEAHHFRNPGLKGEAGERKSHYWQLYDVAEGKSLFLLTATPINNRLIDLQHMIELFSRRIPEYFKDLGIHSLPGHFRKMEKEAELLVPGADHPAEINQVEAGRVLTGDALFRAVVVQRSRAYVKKSQLEFGGSKAIFPERQDPKVAAYRLKKTYGRLLDMVEQAFNNDKPLFSLAMYYPLASYIGPDKTIDPLREGRQKEVVSLIRIQFLKRFESSARAFETSCETLLQKLLAWIIKNEPRGEELRRFERWKAKHGELVNYTQRRQRELWGKEPDEDEEDEDVLPPEVLERAEKLDRHEYKVDEIINESIDDLYQLADFLEELRNFKPANDDKLKSLLKLLRGDPVLSKHKVLIFSEYMATARYLRQQLDAAGFTGVDEVDSASDRDRGEIIQQFSPYYNGLSTGALAAKGLAETRILVSTDVLAEGLNLQDATRLINYDLHWNPVRLMQRIGRVDRRLDPEIEAALLSDHPEQSGIRRTVAYWNFLPPDELDRLLRLYARVAHKTLLISKTFGIEGKKLLTPDDDFEALKDFTHAYEGTTTPIEEMHIEYQRLLHEYPGLEARLDALPGRVFSGKAHPKEGSRAVFLCYALPAPPAGSKDKEKQTAEEWTEEAGRTGWYLYDLATGKVADDPTCIVALIRSTPETPRRNVLEKQTLPEIRAKVEKHVKNTYLKQVQAPMGVSPILKAWMELSS